MTIRDLNRGSVRLLPLILAVLAFGWLAEVAHGESRAAIGVGTFEAKNGIADRGKFALFDVDIDLLIPRHIHAGW